MRLHGMCTGCRKPKLVQVSGHQFALAMARRTVVEGLCADCEKAEQDARAKRRR